jgi:hypothetical protein
MPLAFNLHYWSHSHLPRKVLGLLCLFCLLYQGSGGGGGGGGGGGLFRKEEKGKI